jgi:mannose-1-phosphate guanylyltransferase
MQVMILAAGRSTRLGELGATCPKPLVPICGYPAITFVLALCRQAGLDDVVINLHHRGEQIRRALGDGERHGVRIRYSDERELLGTGGGIARARPLFRSEPVLVLNGKVVANLDLRAVIAAHRAAPAGTLATMVLRPDPQMDRWSPVGVDTTGRVVVLRQQRSDHTPVGSISDLMFTGVHVIEKPLLDRLPEGISDILGEAYIPALREGGRIQAFRTGGYFAEHSTPERYLEGNLTVLRVPGLIPVAPGPLVGVDPAAVVDPGARLTPPLRVAAGAVIEAGAEVGPEVVVGAGARVRSGARVQRSVLWDGAVVDGNVQGTVVTGERRT